MKPDKELRKKYKTYYYDKTDFAPNARLLQSIWRTENDFEFDKYGNFLKLDFAKETGANFLTNKIFEIVKFEVENKHIDGKVIQEPRIWKNLLSSQPLAFNLFGELKINKELATAIFKKLYPDRNIKSVTAIEFEYSPGRKKTKYTGDSSAFDVFIEYKTEKDKKGFFGIGDFIYLYPTENLNCKSGIEKYKSTFKESIENYFRPLTIEKLVETIKIHCSDKWIIDFENRYLDFDTSR